MRDQIIRRNDHKMKSWNFERSKGLEGWVNSLSMPLINLVEIIIFLISELGV